MNDIKTRLGFDPTNSINEQLYKVIGAIEDVAGPHASNEMLEAIGAAYALADNLESAGVLLEWNRFVEDNPLTHPEYGERVIALVGWSKGKHRRYGKMDGSGDDIEATFYQAAYGYYCIASELDGADDEDDSFVFVLDHGDESIDDDDHLSSPPKWWAKIASPQELGMET